MLNFPNSSRFFDTTRRAVQFWGYDSAIEWSFFITEQALTRLEPNAAQGEANLLRVFDTNRAKIYAVAKSAFERERKGSYELVAADF